MPEEKPITVELIQQIIDAIRHCTVLGMKVQSIVDQRLTIELPYSEHLIGNPESGVIHGGALTTLLDTCCGMSIPLAMGEFQIAPTLDLRIDYMTSAKAKQVIYAEAEAYRVTRNVVFCKGIAYQHDKNKPIAHCVATFMRLSDDITGRKESRKKI